MIHVQKLAHITHAVRDREAAKRRYQEALGAREFYDGYLDAQQREASLLLFHDLCIELIDTPPDAPTPDPYVARHGGRFHSMTLRVPNVDEAHETLLQHGVRVLERGPRRLVLDPSDTHGIPFELTDADLPGDPRLAPDWEPADWDTGPQLDPHSLWSISLLVKDVMAARRFFTEVLDGVEVGTRVSGVMAKMSIFFTLGSSRISVLEPLDEETSELSRVIETQGVGLHSICLIAEDPDAVARHLRSQGIAVMGNAATRLVVHPHSFMGARFLIMRQPDPDDPTHAWRQRGAVSPQPGRTVP